MHIYSIIYRSIPKALCLTLSGLLLLAAVAPTQLKAQSVQRLFSTPSERAELDRLRFRIASGAPIEEPVENEPLIDLPLFDDEEDDVIYDIGGTLRKADGSYTVWVNDVAYDQTNLPQNMELLTPFSRGIIRIRDVSSSARYDVKPGQVLNLSTGQLYESYQYQAILAEAAEEAARLAAESAANAGQGTGSVILDSAAVEAVIESAQDL